MHPIAPPASAYVYPTPARPSRRPAARYLLTRSPVLLLLGMLVVATAGIGSVIVVVLAATVGRRDYHRHMAVHAPGRPAQRPRSRR